MKRGILVLALLLFSVSVVSALPCQLGVELINQDPYPAVPGQYVKVVFQMTGVENPECGRVNFQVIENFPFSLAEGYSASQTVQAGTYTMDYKNTLLLPYKFIVSEDALDGENDLEVWYSTNLAGSTTVKKFAIEVEDVVTDFEINVKDYDATTRDLTFEILNVGGNDAEAVTIDIPRQDNIEVRGANRNIIGGLDSNEDTSFSFEAIPSEGEITLNILYTDDIDVRRSLTREVYYDPSYFVQDVSGGMSIWFYVVVVLLIVIVVWWWLKRRARKKREHAGHHHKR